MHKVFNFAFLKVIFMATTNFITFQWDNMQPSGMHSSSFLDAGSLAQCKLLSLLPMISKRFLGPVSTGSGLAKPSLMHDCFTGDFLWGISEQSLSSITAQADPLWKIPESRAHTHLHSHSPNLLLTSRMFLLTNSSCILILFYPCWDEMKWKPP